MNASQSTYLLNGNRWHVVNWGDKGKPRLILIHGFAGSSKTWDLCAPALQKHFQLTLVDLPGHGLTSTPTKPMSFVELTRELHTIFHKQYSETFFLAGYSMGGRIALHYALAFPETVRALALIGASPGIEDPIERAERKQSDDRLAIVIRSNPIEWFVEYWEQQPIFRTQLSLSPALREFIRSEREATSLEGLAYSLENFGTGVQENLLPKLNQLHCPVLLIAGSQDHKFCESNQRIRRQLVHARSECMKIEGCGHAAHIEAPLSVVRAMTEYFFSMLQ